MAHFTSTLVTFCQEQQTLSGPVSTMFVEHSVDIAELQDLSIGLKIASKYVGQATFTMGERTRMMSVKVMLRNIDQHTDEDSDVVVISSVEEDSEDSIEVDDVQAGEEAMASMISEDAVVISSFEDDEDFLENVEKKRKTEEDGEKTEEDGEKYITVKWLARNSTDDNVLKVIVDGPSTVATLLNTKPVANIRKLPTDKPHTSKVKAVVNKTVENFLWKKTVEEIKAERTGRGRQRSVTR